MAKTKSRLQLHICGRAAIPPDFVEKNNSRTVSAPDACTKFCVRHEISLAPRMSATAKRRRRIMLPSCIYHSGSIERRSTCRYILPHVLGKSVQPTRINAHKRYKLCALAFLWARTDDRRCRMRFGALDPRCRAGTYGSGLLMSPVCVEARQGGGSKSDSSCYDRLFELAACGRLRSWFSMPLSSVAGRSRRGEVVV